MTLEEFYQQHGLPMDLPLDGEIHKFPLLGTLDGWLIGKRLPSGGLSVTANSWILKSRGNPNWVYDGADESGKLPSPEEIAAYKKEAEAKKLQRNWEAKRISEAFLRTAKPITSHPYLTKKGLPDGESYGCFELGDGLVVPLGQYSKGHWGYQIISPDGDKKFLPGSKLKGSYHLLLCEDGGTGDYPVIFCEGLATGASLWHALDKHCTVIVCFNASNMVAVTTDYKERSKDWKHQDPLIFAADNDQWTEGNPGLTSAMKAQEVMGRGSVLFPPFPNDQLEKLTDFNDWHVALGLDSLKALLQTLQESSESTATSENSLNGEPIAHELGAIQLMPLKWVKSEDGKPPRKPAQDTVATALYSAYGRLLMREKADVFVWRGTHWKELDPRDFKHFIRRAAQTLMKRSANDKDLNAYYNLLLDKLDTVPEGQSFYKQLVNVANFQDGTLWMLGQGSGLHLEFKPHNSHDLITWALPYKYKAPRPANLIWDEWLERTFNNDPDRAGKVQALRMLAGACLIPMKPCLGFFYGPAGTGKSTFAKIAMRFVGENNYSSLPPEEMEGFMLETMINKRVNIVTDIAGGRVDKGIFKRFHDTMEVTINRKQRTGVKARLPALHLFCGNELPMGMDLVTNAMDRRVAIIEMLNALPADQMEDSIEERILAAGSGAILDFCEQGLKELCARGGKYLNPESGKAVLESHKKENPVREFIAAIENGDVLHEGATLEIVADLKISKPILGKLFCEHVLGATTQNKKIKWMLYRDMTKLGYKTVASRGTDYYVGVGIRGPGF